METMVDIFQALGNPVRFKIVELLLKERKKTGCYEGMCVCNIVKACNVANSTMTHHLDWLTSVGLLTSEKKGRWIYYDVNPDTLKQVKKYFNKLI